jgi:biotin carboxyl carrier protein
MKYITTIDGAEYTVEIIDDNHISVNGQVYAMDFDSICDQPVYSLLLDGVSYEAYVYPADPGLQVLIHGRAYPAVVEDERERLLRSAVADAEGQVSELILKAPMPGLVVAVQVSEGQQVQKGDVLVILESMKMQNELKAPRAGAVTRIKVQPGDSLEQKQAILTIT